MALRVGLTGQASVLLMLSLRPSLFRFRLLVALVLWLASGLACAVDESWDLAADKNDIRVWKRAVSDSPFVEFRAEVTVTSTLSALLNIFYDVNYAPVWLDHVRRVVALRRDDIHHEYVLLIETDMPWPLQDRDAVIQGRWWQEQDSMAIMLRGRSVDDFYPPTKKFIRNQVRSDWTFIPLGKGRVKVVMAGHVDPRGNLPTWAVNMLIQESPLVTLGNLRRVISDPARQAVLRDDLFEPSADFVPPPASGPRP